MWHNVAKKKKEKEISTKHLSEQVLFWTHPSKMPDTNLVLKDAEKKKKDNADNDLVHGAQI